ncbi:MAG: Smr/MutS family protein [bacterium]
MIYPHHFEQKIGFVQIREMLSDHCISPMGIEFVKKIRFTSKPVIIHKLLNQVSEFMFLLSEGKSIPAQDYFDLRPDLEQLKTPGSYIEQEALFNLKTTLSVIEAIVDFLKNTDENAFPELHGLVSEINIPEDLLGAAVKIIDDKGEIKSTASARLADIRKKLDARNKQIMKELRKAFQTAKKSGWVPEQAEITIRDGRAVIPLQAMNKRSLGGIILDESSSGQTVFVEPAAAFELGNQVRELENEERREIIKILIAFTDLIRPSLPSLFGLMRFLGLMDFIRAKALFSQKIKAVQPEIGKERTLVLRNARHPLLYLAHSASGKPVIPLDLELDPENRILVISGPNAGGKSVCLKTIGLLQYMFQCGLPVSCSPDSIFPVFDRIFIDIGDEQSLENDLSTYSSHLINMKYFLQRSNAGTLFLIDEFGTGTEPQLGGAIAEATLERLNQKQAYGVVTTHYANLKLAADRMSGVVNGAMLFDAKEMKPLFTLRVGSPGSSFAFEIAKNIGFPGDVLKNAKTKSGGKHVTFDRQLQQMEMDKISIERKKKEVHATDRQLSEMVEKYTNLMAEIKNTRKQMLEEAREEALRIINESNRAVEKTIKEIKETAADKTRTRIARKRLDQQREKLSGPHEGMITEPKTDQVEDKEIREGDFVRVKETDIVGQLLALEGDTALVDVNDVRLRTSFEKLERSKEPSANQGRLKGTRKQDLISEINEKAAHFELSLDIRGMRADEAIPELQHYIDNAILLNISEVNILHGKGDGILRKLVREFLSGMDEVVRFNDAPLEMGGAGITKIYFR